MKRILLLTFLSLAVSLVASESPYDFRASDAYRKLSAADKQRLEQVQRDLVLLWGALDMYADEHGGSLPTTLDELVPKYLVVRWKLHETLVFARYDIQEWHGIPLQERFCRQSCVGHFERWFARFSVSCTIG